MSFGFGISDFVKLVELAFKTWEKCRQSTSQFKDIGAEVGHTHITLHHIHNFWKAELERGWPLFPDEQAQLKHYSKDCQSALVKLEAILKKHAKIQNSRRIRLKFLVGDLLNDFAAVRDSLQHCTANLTSFHLILTSDVLVRRQNVNEAQMLKRHQETAQILDGLRKTFDSDLKDGEQDSIASQFGKADQSDRETVYLAATHELRQQGIGESVISQNQPLVREWLDTVIPMDEDEASLSGDSDLGDIVTSIGLLTIHEDSAYGKKALALPSQDLRQTRMTESLAKLLDAVMDESDPWDDSADDLLATVFSALDWQGKGYVESSDLVLECRCLMQHLRYNASPALMMSVIDEQKQGSQEAMMSQEPDRVTKLTFLNIMSSLGNLVIAWNEQKEEAELLASVRHTALRKFSLLLDDANASTWAVATQQYLALRQSSVDLDLTVAGLVSMCIDVGDLFDEIRSAVTDPGKTQQISQFEIDEILDHLNTITGMIDFLQAPVKHHYLTAIAALDQQLNTYSRLPTHLAPRLQTFPFIECVQLRCDWWFRLLTLLSLLGDISGAGEDPFKTWSKLKISTRLKHLQPRFADKDVIESLSAYIAWFDSNRLLVERFNDVCKQEDKAFLNALQTTPKLVRRAPSSSHSQEPAKVRIKELRSPVGRYCDVRIILNGVELCQKQIKFDNSPSDVYSVTEIPEATSVAFSLKPTSVLQFEFECLPKALPQGKRKVTGYASCLKIASCRSTDSDSWTVPIHVEHGNDGRNDVVHVIFAAVDDQGANFLPHRFVLGYHSVSQLESPQGWKCILAPFLDQDISRRVYFLNTTTNRPTSIMWRLQAPLDRAVTQDTLDTRQLQLLKSRTDYGFMNDEDRQRTLRSYGKGDLNRNDLEYWV